ncbi:MAG: thiamine pyrophosphate-binding protein [Hyphomicrobiales bacterium]|nr:thiamine pyrophosphate-binding protein [Hyphomicrobiales bacterium]
MTIPPQQAGNNNPNLAQALVAALEAYGIRHAFCVPGESYLALLDALRDSAIALTVCRNEAGAAMMADAVGRATGRPGLCLVTRGPGATNAAPGIYIADRDATPMLMLAGQVDRRWRGREAWQELDFPATFGAMTRWCGELDDPARWEETLHRALAATTAGRPGPAVLALPRDLLSLPVPWPARLFQTPAAIGPDPAALASLAKSWNAAERPLVILGGSGWSAEASASFADFAARYGLPVATSYRRASLFSADHACYAGDLGLGANPQLVARIKASDFVLLLGGRLGEVPSQGYNLFTPETSARTLVHVYPDAAEIGRVFPVQAGIVASPHAFVRALGRLDLGRPGRWQPEADAAHAAYLAWSQTPLPQPGDVNTGEIMVFLRDHLPPDTILCNGAGNYAAWIHRYYRFRAFAAHCAPACASMGYGVPAAVAMKRLFPQRPVICVAGDGDFLMNGQEFATQVQYRLAIVNIIIDNASYGSIRMHQEREYPGREVATDLINPDFAALARAFGGFGATVTRTADFAAAFRDAEASGLPAILHVKVAVEAITPTATLSTLRAGS